jgi:PAS domain S-box-containing protein
MEFVANIVDNMASGLVVTDPSGTIQRVNRRAAEMLGAGEAELRGRAIKEWLQAGEELTDPHRLPYSVETELRVTGGRRIPVKVVGSLQVDDTGRPLGLILILEDLEQMRSLKNQERERERLATIGKVAAGIAHEIRNPLFGISSVAQILGMEASTKLEHRPLLDAMMAEIERIDRMVEELLFYGRPSSLVLTEVDLETVWKSIVLLAAGEIETHELRVEILFSPGTSAVVADAERLRQVFLNLLKNAIDATPPRGEIRIEAEPCSAADSAPGISIRVRDTGGGIAPEKADKIFELFYSEKRGGSGLGLPICKKIVEDHGGHIHVDSSPGSGSTFKLWLPARLPHVASER